MDKTHEQLEQSILSRVLRIDDFFGTVQTDSQRRTSYELRLRNSIRVEQGGRIRPDIALRANIYFPRISEKLHLVVSGENLAEAQSPSLPEDPGNPGFDRTLQPSARVVNTEFRYRLIQAPAYNLFLGAGIKVALPLEPFVRSRFQFTHNFSDIFLIRVRETLFLKYRIGLGETTEVSLERLLDEDTILRFANAGTISEEFRGLEWGSELSWIRKLSPISAITFTGGVYGNSDLSTTVINNYRLLTRYRRNFLKDWLFYELEPEISWPRDSDGVLSPKFALTFRLEILFKAEENNLF